MTIRVGDRVTATNGESTLVGEVVDTSWNDRNRVRVDNDPGYIGGRTLYHSAWVIQKQIPAEPTLGTIVRVKHHYGFNARFIRQEGGWRKVNANGTFDIFTPSTTWESLNSNDSVEIESSP